MSVNPKKKNVKCVNDKPVNNNSWTAKNALRTLGPPESGLVDFEWVCHGGGTDVKRGVVSPAGLKFPLGRVEVVQAGRQQLVEGHRVVVAQMQLERMTNGKWNGNCTSNILRLFCLWNYFNGRLVIGIGSADLVIWNGTLIRPKFKSCFKSDCITDSEIWKLLSLN